MRQHRAFRRAFGLAHSDERFAIVRTSVCQLTEVSILCAVTSLCSQTVKQDCSGSCRRTLRENSGLEG
jgi:hypothetical protein